MLHASACDRTYVLAVGGRRIWIASIAELETESIICFARDWNETPTSNNHVMRELARRHRVLWINSITTRTPNLTSGRDLCKIWRKAIGIFRGAKKADENIWTYTPFVIPLPHSAFAQAINRVLVRSAIKFLKWRLGFQKFQLWSFLPNTADYVGVLGESISIYYCVDEWSGFTNLDGDRIAEAERELCRKVDLVFVVSQNLLDRKRALNRETHLSTHGVDHALFAAALTAEQRVDPQIAALPRPVIGFYGTLQDWVDQDLICLLASRHPDWSIALIGTAYVDTSRMTQFANVHLLGGKVHADLPACCKGFAVGIIPYLITDRMLYVSPLKLREYLSAGLPVVSTAVPEVARSGAPCRIASSHAAFLAAVESALAEHDEQRARQYSDAMKAHSWESKVQALLAHIQRVKITKCKLKANTESGLSARAT